MFDTEPCISTSGKLHGWYVLKPSFGDALFVWIEGLTAFEAVCDVMPRYHFSEVKIIPWQPST
jgi:hypothetical protein